ncbi:Lrp/AsnC family transcriptional regulator [Marinobacter sp. TBZ242]|uniref:siroheme decarboxylase n=1 Tax=Marinobacter azerbaijanicus TaxID=3050455 RepID=A0ABT7IBG3_9GAMM|nr:Lrp/AsnC family transcriptional regulator [Marinobacter sp. TBZ242]MDL0431497.1 Lrp/AsnC family transcriptional regulator [Marinobacter sp. TBZ242]
MSISTSRSEPGYVLCKLDRQLILATQGGLPLVPDPWGTLGMELGLPADEVLARFQRMQDAGVIRRVAAVPDHYRLGYRFNGMTVWDVHDDAISDMGRRVGELPFVSHCYRRPRHLPYWRYNLFAMVHGTSREEVEDKASQIKAVIGDTSEGHTILYSSAILKKTGLRLRKS